MKKGEVNQFITTNVKTGEVIDGVPIYVAPKIYWREDWLMLFQDAFGEIAKDKEMTGQVWRVWAYMISKLAFENYILLQQTDIAKALGIHRQAVHKAMKVILAKGLVVEGPKAGSVHSYKLNSCIGWKGKITNLQLRRYQEM